MVKWQKQFRAVNCTVCTLNEHSSDTSETIRIILDVRIRNRLHVTDTGTGTDYTEEQG